MKKILTTLIILLVFQGFSQKNDTIFYNKYWNKSLKKEAFFYRPLPLKKVNALYEVKDYFMSGNLQMEGYSTSETKDIFHGNVTWFQENGTVVVEKVYSNGTLIDEERSYFRDGSIMSTGLYRDGAPFSGSFYMSSTSRDKTSSYLSGVLHSYNSYYEASKKIAVKTIYNSNRSYRHTLYFSPNGDTLAIRNNFRATSDIPIRDTKVYLSYNKNNNVDRIVYTETIERLKDSTVRTLNDIKGSLVAKGIDKDGYSYSGQFLRDYKLVSYQDGRLEGEAIFYNDAFNQIAKGMYQDGLMYSGSFYIPSSKTIESYRKGVLISKATSDKYSGASYVCTIKDNAPFDGDLFTYESLKSYENGKLKKEIQYDYSTGRKKTERYYLDDGYTITKEIYFDINGEASPLEYRDGIPYQGKKLEAYGYISYIDGIPKGPFLIEDNKIIIIGKYDKDYRKDGEVLYIIKSSRDTLRCTFLSGKPINGTYYETGDKIIYKDGKKEGCGYKTYNNKRFGYDSLSICYENDLPKGTARYYLKDSLVALSQYKNGKPYEGTFYKFQNKKVYNKGALIEKYTVRGYELKQQEFFDDNKPIKTVYTDYKTNAIKYIMNFKKGKPHDGKQMVYDSVARRYTENSFSKGEKHGLETTYKYLYEDFLTQYTYKNGKKDGQAKFRVKFTDTIFKVNYSDDKPVSGTLIDFGKDFVTKSVFKNKVHLLNTYYTTYSHKKIGSIYYKDAQPFNGLELHYTNKKRIAKKYEDGKLVVTYFDAYRFLDGKEPNAQYRIYHAALKDSMVSGSTYKPINYVINYQSKSKKRTGTIIFSKMDTILGTASFKKNNLITFKYTLKNYNNGTETISLIDKKLHYVFKQGFFQAKFNTEKVKIDRPIYQFLYAILNGKIDRSSIELFLDSNEPLSTVVFKDGKPYDGIFFMPEKELYNVYTVVKGNRGERFTGLTKDEVIDKVNALKNTKINN